MSDERNEGLLRKVGDHIAENPKNYNQFDWNYEDSCGTVCCVAGWAAFLNGDVIYGKNGTAYKPDGSQLVDFIDVLAQRALGLDEEEADELFDGAWKPHPRFGATLHEQVRGALYAIADGASVQDVSDE